MTGRKLRLMKWKDGGQSVMYELDVSDVFKNLFAGKDPFEAAFELTGESFRKVKSRHTFRIEVEGKGYFVKLHRGIGLKEYFKNIFQFKRPVMGADQEYHALLHLEKHGVRTMKSAAYGCRGRFGAYRTSFLITDELTETISLEDYTKPWIEMGTAPFEIKRKLIRELGRMAGLMHRSGLNHRDCYICHFLLKKGSELGESPELYVIDLHRAEIREKVPYRYWVKDVAGLYFSAMDLPLTRRDLGCFLQAYFGKGLHEVLKENGKFLEDVQKTALALYEKEERKKHKK